MVATTTTDGGRTAFEADAAAYTREQLEAYLEITDSNALVFEAADLEEAPSDVPERAVAYVDAHGDDLARFAVEDAAIPTLSSEAVDESEFWVLELDEPLKEPYTDHIDND